MKTLKVKLVGDAPLQMQRADLIMDQTNALRIRFDELLVQKKRLKNANKVDTELEMLRCQYKCYAYFEEGKGFYLPSANLQKCLEEGAAKFRLGQAAKSAVIVFEDVLWLTANTATPDNLDEAFEANGVFCFRTIVRTPPRTGARNLCFRPMVPAGWTTEATLHISEDLITPSDVLKCLDMAGRMCGLGAWRPRFGRFSVSGKEIG
jgi:hypothetical protein